jgi:hypothetical protein
MKKISCIECKKESGHIYVTMSLTPMPHIYIAQNHSKTRVKIEKSGVVGLISWD